MIKLVKKLLDKASNKCNTLNMEATTALQDTEQEIGSNESYLSRCKHNFKQNAFWLMHVTKLQKIASDCSDAQYFLHYIVTTLGTVLYKKSLNFVFTEAVFYRNMPYATQMSIAFELAFVILCAIATRYLYHTVKELPAGISTLPKHALISSIAVSLFIWLTFKGISYIGVVATLKMLGIGILALVIVSMIQALYYKLVYWLQ